MTRRRSRGGCATPCAATCCSTPQAVAATRPMRRSIRSCRSASSCRATRTICARRSRSPAARRCRVLARGAGTSQCGQTVGEALVIDTSKWLNNIVSFDADARTVTVEPGVVLDHLNAWLKPHGLWFPVDVSTAAQCTIGGMAGNNSCGSRSIEYGNMVHNVVCDRRRARRRQRSAFRLARETAARRAARRDHRRRAPHRDARAQTKSPSACRRCCAAWRATTSTCSTARTRAPTPTTAREPRASAGRIGGHARVQPADHAEARAAARAQDARRRELPDVLPGDGLRAAHREAAPVGGRTGRSHDDRSVDVQSGVPPGDRKGAGRRARSHPAGRVRRRRPRRAIAVASRNSTN